MLHPNSKRFRLLTFLIFSSALSCTHKADLEAEKIELMRIHNEQRKAHMEKNLDLLLGDGNPDYIEVNRGKISRPTREESRQKFQSYFNSVDFIKWDDLNPPVFNFSEDATMASSVVDKIVITRNKLEGNRLDTAYYAWLAVFQKIDGKWQMVRMGSTNK